MLTLTPVCTSEVCVYTGRCINYLAPRYKDQSKAVASWLRENNVTTVATLTADGAWGDLTTEVYRVAADSAGANVLQSTQVGYIGFEQEMEKLVQTVKANNIEAILFSHGLEGSRYIVRKLRERKVSVKLVGTSNFLDAFRMGALTALPDENYYNTSAIQAEAFVEKFKKRYGKPPISFADRAYDSILLISRTLEHRNNSVEANAHSDLCDVIRKISELKGLTHEYSFDHKGDSNVGEWQVEKIE